MDATVTDFLNEINEISTTKNNSSNSQRREEVWQECYDELTGYSYFWNTETDEVTWVPPKSYKQADTSNKKPGKPNVEREKKKSMELFVPPASQPISSVAAKVDADVKTKVYSLQDAIKKPEGCSVTAKSNSMLPQVKKKVFKPNSTASKHVKKAAPFRKREDSDDEKIELITEYGGGSDSEDDVPPVQIAVKSINDGPKVTTSADVAVKPTSLPNVTKLPVVDNPLHQSDDEDDEEIDLLQQIQQRAKELRKMGGEVPPTVKEIIQKTEVKEKSMEVSSKSVSAFSLVAGYNSDSSEHETEEVEPVKTLFPLPPPISSLPETSHSTLFPITKPIDVKDFISPEVEPTENLKSPEGTSQSKDFDAKAFQRKRRIGVSLVNQIKRPKGEVEGEFSGLGFKNDAEIKPQIDFAPKVYPGFQKGGVMFVKTDVLNPSLVNQKKAFDEEGSVDEESKMDEKKTENDYTVLKEKLLFLGEGREPVLPVQAMLIQAETLFLAMKEGGLKLSYLYKWLKEMCSELVKLEKEAAPDGWLLQWDRSHKRYFYQNQTTGVSQWRYPEPDVTRCDDAMDISTTPPPQDVDGENVEVKQPPSPLVFGPQLPPPDPPLPPSPPNIRSPTPPPPPVISGSMKENLISSVPLPPEPLSVERPPPPPPSVNPQPLPPGVDLLPNAFSKRNLNPEPKAPDSLTSALDSFYSQIADVTENSNSHSPLPVATVQSDAMDVASEIPSQPEVKKKKKKVKLAQGLTMKKKGVSQLVEKWKNLHNSYAD